MEYIYIIYIILFVVLCFFAFKATAIWHLRLSMFFLIVFMFVWRLDFWYATMPMGDEAEWLSLVSRLDTCHTPFLCFNSSTSGFLSIWILALMQKLGFGLDYFSLRAFGFLFFIIPSVILMFEGILVKYCFNTLKFTFPWLGVLMIFSFYNAEFLTYNTEYQVMFFLSAFFYCLVKFFKSNEKSHQFNKKYLWLTCLLLGILPHIKIQTVPIVFSAYISILYTFLKDKKYIVVGLSIFIMLIPTMFFLSYFYVSGILNDFYTMFLKANTNNVNNRISTYKYADQEWLHRLRAFKGMHLTTFGPIYTAFCSSILLFFKRPRIWFNTLLKIELQYVIIFIFTCYATYASGNGFGHYNILLLVPVIYLISSFINNLLSNLKNHKILSIYTVLAVLYPVSLYCGRADFKRKTENSGVTQVELFLKGDKFKSKSIMFLGWHKAIDLQLRLKRSLIGRNPTYQYITIENAELRDYYHRGFISDIEIEKPDFIVDTEFVLDMPNCTRLNKRVNNLYYLDTAIEGNLIYSIKSK